MITHVVLAKLKDQSAQNIESTRLLLSSLNGKIPSLRRLEVGKDLIRSERSYDVALIARFDDFNGLKAYQTHPIHVPISDKLRELAASIVAVDYESS
jgi:hypothetical protein